jgi:hypothetical protein
MKKRLASMALWFYAGWTFGAMIAMSTGMSPVVGPILGTAAAAVFAGDPRRIIWSRPTSSRTQTAGPHQA